MNRNYKILNYYDNLPPHKQAALKEKKSCIFYYDLLDEVSCLSMEERGILISCLLHYAKSHGQSDLPDELSEKINDNKLLCFMFYTLQKREAKATLEWLNHKRYKKTFFTFSDGKTKALIGNTANAPKSYKDYSFADSEWFEFIDYGNDKGWNKPFTDLAVIWEEEKDEDLPY